MAQVAAAGHAKTVTEAVEVFAGAVAAWATDDPRWVTLALVRAYAERIDSGEGDWRMGEAVCQHMRTLAIEAAGPPDMVDEIRARGAARMIESLARQSRGEVLPVSPAVAWSDGPPDGDQGWRRGDSA